MTDTWWLKFERAQQHRREAEAMISQLLTNPVPTIEVTRLEVDGQWEFFLHHTLDVPEQLPVIVGDFMFNLRSALDHIVSINLPGRTNKTPFPIYSEDFTTFVPGEPERFAGYRKNWKALRSQLPRGVFGMVELAQPFVISQIGGADPNRSALSILNFAQNADKHNALLPVMIGIEPVQGTVVLPDGRSVQIENPPKGGVFRNGSRIIQMPTEAMVEFVGRLQFSIVAGFLGSDLPLPQSFEDWSEEVRQVLLGIERNMP